MSNNTNTTTKTPPQANAFVCMLYPDFDENHRRFIKYVKAHEAVYEYAYIRHDKDVYDKEVTDEDGTVHPAGEPKKAHVHFLLWCKQRKRVQTLEKFFEGWVKHFEICNDVQSTLLYFVHDTPASMHKHQYDPSEIEGTARLIAKAFDKARILYNLKYFADASKKNMRLTNIIDDIATCDEATQEQLLNTLTRHTHLVVAMNNQEINYTRELARSFDSMNADKLWQEQRMREFREERSELLAKEEAKIDTQGISFIHDGGRI